MANIVSATFVDREDARRAVNSLRDHGVPDDAITIVGRHPGDEGGAGEHHVREGAEDTGGGALTGAGLGAAVGALFGLATFAIPGIGPFLTAGALANALGAAGGAAASGALVGATAGGLAGALSHWGLNEAEARHYASEVEQGHTYIGVDLDRARVDHSTVVETFGRHQARRDTPSIGLAGAMPGGSSPTIAESLAARTGDTHNPAAIAATSMGTGYEDRVDLQDETDTHAEAADTAGGIRNRAF